MIESIDKAGEDERVYINIFDVEFSATDEDIRKLYPEIKILSLTSPKEGIFIFELVKE